MRGKTWPAVPELSLTREDVNRWKMAARAAELFGPPHDQLHLLKREPFRQRCRDHPNFEDVLKKRSLVLGFSAAAIIYGGLHALAWFAHFRSSTEQLLWRISSVAVMSGIPISAAVYNLYVIDVKLPDNRRLVSGPLIASLIASVALIYIIARVYLVIECFIQLSHLPAGVFQQPEWSTYFPHIA
ncbi:MAG: hypothetical protein Q9168_007625 [Polycauliona sp. 1 TL-2023]